MKIERSPPVEYRNNPIATKSIAGTSSTTHDRDTHDELRVMASTVAAAITAVAATRPSTLVTASTGIATLAITAK